MGIEIGFVIDCRLAIDPHRPVFTSTAVGFLEPLQIHQVAEARETQRRRTSRQLGDPMRFHGYGVQVAVHPA